MRIRLTWLTLAMFLTGLVTACTPPGTGTGTGACSFKRPAAAPAVEAAAPKPKPKSTKTRKVNACTKATSPIWKSFQPYKGSWRTDGGNKFYQWDNLHGDIEEWKRKGGRLHHQGSLDPEDGTLYKGPKHAPQPMP